VVLGGLIPPLDLALGLWMICRRAYVIHAFCGKLVCQFARHITGAIIGQQALYMPNGNPVAA
jgi:hypothetical protein